MEKSNPDRFGKLSAVGPYESDSIPVKEKSNQKRKNRREEEKQEKISHLTLFFFILLVVWDVDER